MTHKVSSRGIVVRLREVRWLDGDMDLTHMEKDSAKISTGETAAAMLLVHNYTYGFTVGILAILHYDVDDAILRVITVRLERLHAREYVVETNNTN